MIETPIKAGFPEFVCKKCGKPREKILKSTGNLIAQGGYASKIAIHLGVSPISSLLTKNVKEKAFIGYNSCCKCIIGFEQGIVLDPFMGSGTTALVALKLNRRFEGIETNQKYIEMAMKRIKPYLQLKKSKRDGLTPNIFKYLEI
ncbi:MAG: DNA methyltransferase [bacterium]